MTEKRYSLVYYADKGGAFIRDNKNSIEWYHDSRASLLEIVDKLNELTEENQDNKAMIEFLSTENTQMMNELKTRTQIQHQLEEENEQLKQELFDSECECIEVHYHDNEVRRDNKIEELKIEFKERFGRDFE